MTNNRINNLPILTESSVFLKKILVQRSSNSAEKKINFNSNNNSRLNIVFSPEKNINNLRLNYEIKSPAYDRINLKVKKMSKSPILGGKFNFYKNNNFHSLNNNLNVLKYKGKKIFTNSFNPNKINNKTEVNSISKDKNYINNKKESELYRNYNELIKKKDEIYKRKINKDKSVYRKQILINQKNKDIKTQNLNLKLENKTGNNNDKFRIIPLKKKLNKVQSHLRFNTNNFIKADNNHKINAKIKENLNYFRIKNEKINNNINKTNYNDFNNLNIKKKFVEDYNLNLSQIIYSDDNKISIKMHTLKDKNVIFEKKGKKIKNLEIQKPISLFYKCYKNDNSIKNGINHRKRYNRNLKVLNPIKEEEDKSKKIIENSNKETNQNQNKDNDNKFEGNTRRRYWNRFKTNKQ